MSQKKRPTLPLIAAIDFDGTLETGKYPLIGEPKVSKIDGERIIDKVLELRRKGWYLILWTCRQGKTLDEAIAWCATHGLVFDTINDDHPDAHEAFGFSKEDIKAGKVIPSRKIFYNILIDDRVWNVEDF